MTLSKPHYGTVLGIVFTTFSTLVPQHANAENLVDIYRLALQQDRQLRAAEAGYLAAAEARPQARSVLLPQIGLGGSLSQTDQDAGEQFGQPTDAQSVDNENLSLNLSQTIYNHQNYVSLKQAKVGITQAEVELEAARQDLLLRVADAYFNVLAAEDTLKFAKAEKEAIGRQLEQSEKRFEVGLIAITDVKESQASYDIAVANEISAENQLDISREFLQVITGQLHQNLSKLGDTMQLARPEPADIDKWIETSLEQNFNLRAAQLNTKVSSLEIRRQRAGHYPTLDLFASKDISKAEIDSTTTTGFNSSSDRDEETIGISLNVPIYSGGRTSSLTRQARYTHEQNRELLEQQHRNTISLARASYRNVVAGISRVKALKQALISNQTAAEATQAGFEVGTRTSVDVLLALRETFRSQRDYAQARYDYLLNTLKLKQAAGILSEDDLVKINGWLN